MVTKINSGGNKQNNGREFSHLTSLIILIFLVPILLFFGANTSQLDNPDILKMYDFTVVLISSVILIYGIYEITNFVNPYKEKRKEFLINFSLISFLFLLLYLFFGITFILRFNYGYDLFADPLILFSDGIAGIYGFIIITIILYFAFSAFYSIIAVLFDIKTKDALTIYGVATLLFLFMISGIVTSKFFNWVFIFLIILTTVASDTFAYLGGRKYGRIKVFPKTSPNKTVEGLSIGFVSAVVVGIAWFLGFIYWFNFSHFNDLMGSNYYGWYGFIVSIIIIFVAMVAPIGDYAFSKIKRSYNKKDFSNFLPGHGGLFDRIDSHIFTMITATLLFILFFLLI